MWRTMRAERSDAILVAPEGGSLGAAARWRPVVRTLLGAVRKHVSATGSCSWTCGCSIRSRCMDSARWWWLKCRHVPRALAETQGPVGPTL